MFVKIQLAGKNTKRVFMQMFQLTFVITLFANIAISGCTPLRGAQNYERPNSPCEANYKSEGGRTSGYKTSSSVTFSKVSDAKVFNATTIALTDSNYTVLSSDKEAGIITANYNAGDMVQARISVQIKKMADGASIVIKITTPAVYGDIPADCCQLISKIEEHLDIKAITSSSAQENFSSTQENSPQQTKIYGNLMKAIKNCNVRPEPSTKKAPIATLKAGEAVEKIAQHGDWINIRLGNGSEGWIYSSLVE